MTLPVPEEIPCGETADEIPDGHRLCRRFIDDENHLTWDGDRPIPHPSSPNSFNMEKGRSGLSTSWREHLERHNLSLEVVLAGDPDYTLVGQVNVGVVRDIGLLADHDPTSDQPLGCAHSVIRWSNASLAPGSDRPSRPDRKRLKTALSRAFDYVLGEITTPRPPDN